MTYTQKTITFAVLMILLATPGASLRAEENSSSANFCARLPQIEAQLRATIAKKQAVRESKSETARTRMQKHTMVEDSTTRPESVSAYITTVTEAIERAVADCGAGIDTRAIQRTYTQTVTAAQKMLRSEKKSFSGIKEQLQNFAEKRKESIQAAEEKFRQLRTDARAKLQTSITQ